MPSWTCTRCGEEVDPEFDVCWSCGTSADGTIDPHFRSADDEGRIDDPVLNAGLPTEVDTGDELAEGFPDVVACYQARDVMEAHFLAERLRERGIPAISDTQNMNMTIGGFMPQAWGYGPCVRVRPQDLERAREWLATYDRQRQSHRDADAETSPDRDD